VASQDFSLALEMTFETADILIQPETGVARFAEEPDGAPAQHPP